MRTKAILLPNDQVRTVSVKAGYGERILFSMLFFFYFYSIKIAFIPLGLSKVTIAICVLWALWEQVRHGQPLKLPTRQLYFSLILILLAVYSVIITIFRGVNDFDAFSKYIFIFYESVLGTYFCALVAVNRLKFTLADIFEMIFYITLVQAVLTIISYLVPPVNFLFAALLPNTGNIVVDNMFRVRGFTNLGGAWLSYLQSVGVLCGLFLMETATSTKKFLLYFLLVVIITSSTIIIGRTGLMLCLGYIGVYCARWLFKRSTRKRLFKMAGIVVLLLIMALPYLTKLVDNIDAETIEWAFEIFTSDSASTSSTSELEDMLVFPKDPSHAFWGIGFYEKPALGYDRSDSGYFKSIYAVGLFGCILLYGMYVYIFWTLLKIVNSPSQRQVLLVFCSSLFLVEIKEPFFQTVGATTTIFTVYYVAWLYKKHI